MKFDRKCPGCNRKATKRISKLSFCESCAKYVHKNHTKYAWGEEPVGQIGPLTIYRDYPIPIYKRRGK